MNSRIVVVLVLGTINLCAASYTMAAGPAITTYGERNPQAPDELDLFSFLVGKWIGRKRLENESYAEWTWIGRYGLNGTAIADELHAVGPDGKEYLGGTLRHFDTKPRLMDHRVSQRHAFLCPQAGESAVGLREPGFRQRHRHF